MSCTDEQLIFESTFAYTSPQARNASSVATLFSQSLLKEIPERNYQYIVLNASDMGRCDHCVSQLKENSSQVVVVDCASGNPRDVELLIAELSSQFDNLRGFDVLLCGTTAQCRSALSMVPCAAVIAPAIPRIEAVPSFREVHVETPETASAVARESVLLAALHYLQRAKMPHIVTRGHGCERFIAALVAEALRCLSVSDHVKVEEASQLIGLRPSVFQMMDEIGAEALLRFFQQTKTTPVDGPAPVPQRVLERMRELGLLRGRKENGLYSYANDGAILALNHQVFKSLFLQPTAAQIADRMLLACINECCAMIVDGEVDAAQDCNIIAVACGFAAATGGVLGNSVNASALLDRMNEHSKSPNLTITPHPLLRAMNMNNDCFGSLRDRTIEMAKHLGRDA
jgi:Ni,Fe-hydrogenase III small subunit